MKTDIAGRKEVELLVNSFYEKVQQDELLGRIFNDLMNVDWSRHLPKMYDFWENVLFQTGRYKGFPFGAHLPVNAKERLTEKHFETWLNLFTKTVDELFEGVKAEEIKIKARNIKEVWAWKIESMNNYRQENAKS